MPKGPLELATVVAHDNVSSRMKKEATRPLTESVGKMFSVSVVILFLGISTRRHGVHGVYTEKFRLRRQY